MWGWDVLDQEVNCLEAKCIDFFADLENFEGIDRLAGGLDHSETVGETLHLS
jgi:hypothetical protein